MFLERRNELGGEGRKGKEGGREGEKERRREGEKERRRKRGAILIFYLKFTKKKKKEKIKIIIIK